MNRQSLIVVLALLAAMGSVIAQRPAARDVVVYFSPKGGATDAIVRELGAAKSEVKVLAYSFTSAPIAEALAKAHARGVKVTIVLDDSNERDQYTGATYLLNHGIQPLIDHRHSIAHNKVMIIDRGTVITGSMNFTKAGEESNSENVLIIKRAEIAAQYLAEFQEHADHAREYRRR